MTKVDPVPKGYHTVTTVLTLPDVKAAIEFYKKAFNAEEKEICYDASGKKVMHAEIKIGDSIIMMGEEFPQMGCLGPQKLGGTPVSMFLYVDNVDAWFERATKAGATASMPVADMFWGDRWGQLTDPFGHKWGIATHTADLTPEQIKKGQEEWEKSMMACAK